MKRLEQKMLNAADGRVIGAHVANENSAKTGNKTSTVEKLEVLSGDQTGSSLSIEHQLGFTVGTGYGNDIVLRCKQAEPVRLRVEYSRGKRYIKLMEGSVSVAGDALMTDQLSLLPDAVPVAFGGVSFIVSALGQGECVDAKRRQVRILKPVRDVGAMMALVAGSALLGVMLMQDYGMADTDLPSPVRTLQQQLDELGLDNLHVVENRETGSTIVQGRVSSREELHRVSLLRDASQNVFTLEAQVDAVLTDAIRDVYRNHDISAEVEVVGNGHVSVETQHADEVTLMAIETALKSDLPMLKKMDIVNIPADVPENSGQVTFPDPAKDVEVVVAGSHPYVITRDQARYFVGAVLPSGHTITSIDEGTVVVFGKGEEIRLEF